MRGYDYDHAYRRRMAERDRQRARRGYDYDRGFRAALNEPEPLSGWFPGAFMMGAPMYGWGWWGGAWGWPPYGMADGHGPRPGYDRPMRIDPRESSNYGRSADRAVQQWARRYGYDVELELRPRRQK